MRTARRRPLTVEIQQPAGRPTRTFSLVGIERRGVSRTARVTLLLTTLQNPPVNLSQPSCQLGRDLRLLTDPDPG